MAHIFLTWELGSGLGHVVPMAHLAAELTGRGHRITVALRQPTRANFFGHLPQVQCVAAPFRAAAGTDFLRPSTFAHLLYNAGWGDAGHLAQLVAEWRALFDEFSPDLVVCDHSPTALLAAAASDLPRATYGTGFCCPPPCEFLPNWRPYAQHDVPRLQADERTVLDHLNGVLADCSRPPLENVSALYHEGCTTLLATFAELDHFGPRAENSYMGTWPSEVPHALSQRALPVGAGSVSDEKKARFVANASGSAGSNPPFQPPQSTGDSAADAFIRGDEFALPAGGRWNFFAYLKPFRQLPALLGELIAAEMSGLVFVEGMAARLRATFPQTSIQFADRPVDIAWAARHCDVALLHATHASTAQWLLAGVPVLLLPLSLEQQLLAQRVGQLQAGVAADPRDATRAVAGVRKLLGDFVHRQAAERFAAQYGGHSPRNSLRQCADRLVGSLNLSPSCPGRLTFSN